MRLDSPPPCFFALCSTKHETISRPNAHRSAPRLACSNSQGFFGALRLSAISMCSAFSTMRGMLSASH